MWSQDRDMASIEARLLDEVVWQGRIVWSGQVTVFPNKVLVEAPAVVLDSLGVGPGWIALLGETTVEIEALEGEEFVVVSQVRAAADGPRIPAWPVGSSVSMRIVTFEHARRVVHERMRSLLRLSDAAAQAVVNVQELARTEAIGALHLVYGQASPSAGADSVAASKAALYGRKFEERVRMLRAVIETEDGRRFVRRSVVRLERE